MLLQYDWKLDLITRNGDEIFTWTPFLEQVELFPESRPATMLGVDRDGQSNYLDKVVSVRALEGEGETRNACTPNNPSSEGFGGNDG